MNKEKFSEIRKEFGQLMLIDDDNLLDMSRERPYLHSKYLNFYNDELMILNNLKNELEKLYGETYKEVKFNSKYAWNTKGEIETQILANDLYYGKKQEYDYQKLVVDFFGSAIDILKGISFDIKNYTEYKMFLFGR